MRRIWPGVAATARSSAISRSRCCIDRPSVLATTNIAMNIDSPPKAAVTGIKVVRTCSKLRVLGAPPRVSGQYFGAACGGAQARDVEAGAREDADRVDSSRVPGQPGCLGVGQEHCGLLRDGLPRAGPRRPR